MIQAKLLELQKTVKALKKDKEAYNYDYTSGDKILSVVRPKMDDLGILLLPEVTGSETQPISYKTYNKQAKAYEEKLEYLYKLRIRFTWYDTEDGTTLAQDWEAYGMNAFDKGFGSALTYGERYYLLKVLHIATDRDDVDAVSRERDRALDQHPDAEPAKPYQPCSDERYTTFVSKAAAGEIVVSKSGRKDTAKNWWIRETNADQAAQDKFDRDVALWKAKEFAKIFEGEAPENQ